MFMAWLPLLCYYCLTDVPTAPIAMETSPWETLATKAGGDDEEWSAFEGAENSNSNDSTGWADFSNLNDARTLDGGPRVSSPDALSEKLANDDNSSNGSSSSNAQGSDLPTESKSDSSLNESLEQSPLSDDEQTPDNAAIAGDTSASAPSPPPTSSEGAVADVPEIGSKESDSDTVSMEVVSSITLAILTLQRVRRPKVTYCVTYYVCW